MVFMEMGLLIHQNNSLLQLGAVFPLGLWLFFPFHSNNHINFYNILFNIFFLQQNIYLQKKSYLLTVSLNSESYTLRKTLR